MGRDLYYRSLTMGFSDGLQTGKVQCSDLIVFYTWLLLLIY